MNDDFFSETELWLFAEIKALRKPAFDFDLASLVLEQLPQPKPESARNEALVYCLVFAAFGSLGIPVYLYHEYVAKMFAQALPAAMDLAIGTTILILLFLGIEMYRTYKRRMNALNY